MKGEVETLVRLGDSANMVNVPEDNTRSEVNEVAPDVVDFCCRPDKVPVIREIEIG